MRYESAIFVMFCVFPCAFNADAEEIRFERIPGQAALGSVEIHGVGAGAFREEMWRGEKLHFLPDERSPLLAPRLSGVFRNIYAPSAVKLPEGWRVFYGAWDGINATHDLIYSVDTHDFLDFGERTTVIDHGDFVHVCNVNAIRHDDGSYAMLCTVYPDAQGQNKPAFFSSPDGRHWNGSPAPYAATHENIVSIAGYPDFAQADMNGMNVLLYETGPVNLGEADGKVVMRPPFYRMYFGDFKARGKVFQAVSKDGRHYTYLGPCLEPAHLINDVKKIATDDGHVYLMALHGNRDRLWYALSEDGMRFDRERLLAVRLDEGDRYIVAVGWVVDGDRVLGFLYGAGAVPGLNRNRIYGRWLQKKVVFTDEGGRTYEAKRALCPDRQILSLGEHEQARGRLQVFAEDGVSPLGDALEIELAAGSVYRLRVDEEGR